MLTIIDNTDVMFHYASLKSAGIIPQQVKLDSVSFERGGGVLVDGAIDLPVVGGFDVKLKLMAKLLPDLKTIRLRVVDVTVSGYGTRGLVMMFLKKIVENITVPGLRFVPDGADGYIEYKRPQGWILLSGLQTADNRLTLVLRGIDIPAAMKEFQAAADKAMETSGSLAQVARIGKGTAHGVSSGNGEPAQIYTAPNISGDINAKVNL